MAVGELFWCYTWFIRAKIDQCQKEDPNGKATNRWKPQQFAVFEPVDVEWGFCDYEWTWWVAEA